MCMKYINAIITPYTAVVLDEETHSSILALKTPINCVRAMIKEDGHAYIQGFDIVTDLTFLGTAKETNAGLNPVVSGKTIDVTIRLTRCSKDENARRYVDLDAFSVDLKREKEKENLNHACFDYYSQTRVTKVDSSTIMLFEEDGKPAFGPYVLKVIVKERTPEGMVQKETVQGMAPLKIIECGT